MILKTCLMQIRNAGGNRPAATVAPVDRPAARGSPGVVNLACAWTGMNYWRRYDRQVVGSHVERVEPE